MRMQEIFTTMRPETIRNLYGEAFYFTAVRFTDAGSQSRGCLITVSAEKWQKLRRAAGTVLALILAHVILERLVVSGLGGVREVWVKVLYSFIFLSSLVL